MERHTDTPWKMNQYGSIKSPKGETVRVTGVALPCGGVSPADEGHANAAFIVRAVNCHEQLVEALGEMVASNGGVAVMPTPEARAQNAALEKARAALAAAKGES